MWWKISRYFCKNENFNDWKINELNFSDPTQATRMQSGVRNTGLILGLQPANERRRYKVTPSLIGWAQA